MNLSLLNVLAELAKQKQPEIRNFRLAAAVVYKHREIVTIGYPRKKTHPVQKLHGNNDHSIYLHAEIDALIKALRSTALDKHYTMYVARVKQKPNGHFILGIAKPCNGCKGFIHKCGIDEIVFTKD